MNQQDNPEGAIKTESLTDLELTTDIAEQSKGGIDVPVYKIVIDPRSGSLY
jgi:hypothetical protein